MSDATHNTTRRRSLGRARVLDMTHDGRLGPLGVPPVTQIHEPIMWPRIPWDADAPRRRAETPPDLANVAEAAAKAKGPVVIDCDHVDWPRLTDDAETQRYVDLLAAVCMAARGATPHPIILYGRVAVASRNPWRNYVHPHLMRGWVHPGIVAGWRMRFDRVPDGSLVPGRLPRAFDAIGFDAYWEAWGDNWGEHTPHDPATAWRLALDVQIETAKSWRMPIVAFGCGDEPDDCARVLMSRRDVRVCVFGPKGREEGPLTDRIRARRDLNGAGE